MTAIAWDEEPIGKKHDRAAFDCGDPDLNLYLQKFARQNHESGGAKCFIAAPSDAPARVLGFTTLSPASIEYSRTPALAKKGLARYDVPVFRLDRLAVDRTVQSRGLGGALLLRAHDGALVPLAAVASLDMVSARSLIDHEDGLRRQVVVANPKTTDQAGYPVTHRAPGGLIVLALVIAVAVVMAIV